MTEPNTSYSSRRTGTPEATTSSIAAYLESKYLDEFDAWRKRYRNPFKDLTGGTRNRNWDDERRIAELEADGVVAEVIFPNTIPPFFPTGAVVARPPTPDDYELRLAGIRAHNRWLADWCRDNDDRRAGIGQIFLNDLDDAVTDVRWCHEHGLRGGVLIQPVPDDMKGIKPLYAPDYDPLWAVCEDLGVIVNTHSGGGGMPDYGPYPAAGLLWIAETRFYSRRPLTQMLASGVFERFPQIRFVLTEQGASWIAPLLAQLDSYHLQMKRVGRIGELKYDPEQVPATPARRVLCRGIVGWGSAFLRRLRLLPASTSVSTDSCGEATIPTMSRPIPTLARASAAPSPARPRTSCNRFWAATPPSCMASTWQSYDQLRNGSDRPTQNCRCHMKASQRGTVPRPLPAISR